MGNLTTVSGVVKAKSNKYDKHSILIDNAWYNSKFEINCEKGDMVEFQTPDDKKWCQGLKVVGAGNLAAAPSATGYTAASKATAFPIAHDARERSIVRQNSLAHAVGVLPYVGFTDVLDDKGLADRVVDIARVFEEYSTGTADFEEAAADLNGSL